MKLRYRIIATKIALAVCLMSSACQAAEPAKQISSERITLPFHYSPAASNPMAAFNDLFRKLRARAQGEARDGEYEPDVSSTPYRDGRWTLISALTPRRGVFYWVLTGPYGGPGSDYTILPARESLSVCRLTITWDSFPDGPVVPGLYWAGFAFPEPDCSTPAVMDASRLATWRRDSASATYTIIGKAAEGSVKAWLVIQAQDKHPFNASSAVAAIVDRSDSVIRATPVASYGWTGSFVKTRSGRIFSSFPDHFDRIDHSGTIGCLVEGVEWKDLAAGKYASKSMRDSEKVCGDLVQQHRAADIERHR